MPRPEMARVVLGFPMYRSEDFVRDALEALLSLDFHDLAVVAVDDCSPDDTLAIAREYAAADDRLVVEANPRRLGMIANWNRTLARAYELHPEFEYFAWASDNDVREPSWASKLVEALEEEPGAALAYSRFGRIEDGVKTAPPRWIFESRGIGDPQARFRATIEGMRAGPIMYGLHRRTTLERAGNVPDVLLSDVLFLSHLSLYGTFVQVPEVLWYRGARKTGAKRRRQRRALFAEAPPVTTFLPVSLQHALWLLKTMVIDDRRPPGVGRGLALRLSGFYLLNWWERLIQRAITKGRKWRGKRVKAVRRRASAARKRLVRARRAVRAARKGRSAQAGDKW